MRNCRYLIVGGGPAAGYAAKKLAGSGLRQGELMIVSSDAEAPYKRPPLSKGFLRGKQTKDKITINPPSFYDDHGITLMLDTPVVRFDPGKRQAETASGETVAFEQALLATGSVVRRLDVPGADTAPVHYLRLLSDAETIRDKAARAEAPLVIGAGYIGLEVAASIAMLGKPVRVVSPEDRPLGRLFTAEMAAFFSRYYEDRGVTLMHGAEVVGFRSGSGDRTQVQLKGGETLETDFLVAGIGVTPAVDLYRNTGIEVDDGVLVDEYLQTSVEGIYAAGDIARYQDVLFGKRRRIEHWQNAVDQGEHAAQAMAGRREVFRQPPYFFSDMFDLGWEFWGDPKEADEVLYVGDVDQGAFSVWWLRDGRVNGVFVLNRPDDERDLASQCAADRAAVPQAIHAKGRAVTV